MFQKDTLFRNLVDDVGIWEVFSRVTTSTLEWERLNPAHLLLSCQTTLILSLLSVRIYLPHIYTCVIGTKDISFVHSVLLL